MRSGSLNEELLESEELFNGRFLHAFRDKVVLPDGSLTVREYFVHPGAVMVIPILQDDGERCMVVLERQFRYPVGKVIVEFPAGKLDRGEAAFDCARRELKEETGYAAQQWARAGIIHPAVAYSTETIEVGFARGLVLGSRCLDDGEFLEVFSATSDELFQWCSDGTITDGKTMAGVLWLQNVNRGAWALNWQNNLIDEVG